MKNDFNRDNVYALLKDIPRARVMTYGELAERLGNKAWARAVGNALHSNPDGNKFPCYKVVSSKGELSRAYAFGGIDEQRRRLEAEGIRVRGNRVDLDIYGVRAYISIETERLLLRPWRQEDANDLYEYARDSEVGYPAGWPAHTSVENSRDIIRSVLSVPETYAICLKEDGTPIGCVGLKMGAQTDMTERDDECEIGYWLAKPFWGRGIMTEAARVLIKRAFEILGMRAVWGGYYEGNIKSRRVQEKLGFAYHHTTKELGVPLLNEIRTGHVMLLKKDVWQARENSSSKQRI